MKPGFLPARIGVGRSLLALGLIDDAERSFDEVLRVRPEDVDARLGKAAVLGARARPKEEVAEYRRLLTEDETRAEVRAHLLAALIDLGDWPGAKVEIEALLVKTPEEPQLRFLHSEALARTGEKAKGAEERVEARRLGLTYEREVALCQHLGITPPELPTAASMSATPEGSPPAAPKPVPRKSRARRPATKPRKATRSKRSPSGAKSPLSTPSPVRKRK